ncbi:MAG: carboxyl transferase domain-containing protein [Polyangiaceae bacterium]
MHGESIRTFERIAVLGRNEAGLRFIRAVREHRRESGAKLSTVALHGEHDRRAPFVREADEAFAMDAPIAWHPSGPRQLLPRDVDRVEEALRATRAEALWLGWESAHDQLAFAELCERLGLVFLGPSTRILRRLVDPQSLTRLAEGAGARLATHEDERARRVEVQLLADQHGSVKIAGLRDSTLRVHHRLLVTEAPPPTLRPEDELFARAIALRIARALELDRLASVVLLFEPSARSFSFSHVGFSLSHPTTEMLTDLDLVKLALRLALGDHLEEDAPLSRGHAIAVHLTAEDPERGFARTSELVERLRWPTGPALRVDCALVEGETIAAELDPNIATMSVWGRTRTEALARITNALAESTLVVRGSVTTKSLLLGLVSHAAVVDGTAERVWLERRLRERSFPRQHGEVALVAVAIEAYCEAEAVERAQFYASASRGRPKVPDDASFHTRLDWEGQRYHLVVRQRSSTEYEVRAEGCVVPVRVERTHPHEAWLVFSTGANPAEQSFRVLSTSSGFEHVVEVDGVTHRVTRDMGGAVRAPGPAVVLSMPVAAGELVSLGDRVAVLEAMKMEIALTAPTAGRVREVLVRPNAQVDVGTPLLVIEPSEASPASIRPTEPRARFDALARPAPTDARARWRQAWSQLREWLLGWDVDDTVSRTLASAWRDSTRDLPIDDPELERAEDEALGIFADVQALFRRQRTLEDEGTSRASAEEYLFVYLRSLDARGHNLPSDFQPRLLAALRHYGVDELAPTATLREALYRLFRARSRGADHAHAMGSTVERRRVHAASWSTGRERFHGILERVISVARRRFPLLHEAALELRHVLFDEPQFERARADVRDRALAELRELTEAGDRPSELRTARIATLVDCPEQLLTVFAPEFERASPALRAAMLEILLRRYYRIRSLSSIEVGGAGAEGCSFAKAEYPHEGRTITAVAACASAAHLAAIVRDLDRKLTSLEVRLADVVVDLYVYGATAPSEDDLEESVRAALDEGALSRGLRRVALVVECRLGGAATQTAFTYRADGARYVEDPVVRGVHPMLAKRMQLWRLDNFDLARLPSSRDVLLFKGVAKKNRKDERLFAVAEVRDLSVVRDPATGAAQLPYLERMLAEALSAIRVAQFSRSSRDRLGGNRVLLYLWPPLRLGAKDLARLVKRLAPETEGLGIEQVTVSARIPNEAGALEDKELRIENPLDQGLHVSIRDPSDEPVQTLSEYEQKVLALKRRGLVYPYEIVKLLTTDIKQISSELSHATFDEYDLTDSGELAKVDRPLGLNTANIVVGVLRSFGSAIPEGMVRVVLLGDASREMGSLSEPECRRIMLAIDLAERMRVPIEWFALSAGAKISMKSGTENMDWIADVLRRIVEFSQRGGEINVVVCGINVGAQPYWNAEATMLMHTRGILIMLADSAMVLTGKQALDYSGSVSAEDNQGIGGYERVMGPNGQAQYLAPDLPSACRMLLAHYEHTYVVPGERFPRRVATTDPPARDIRLSPHPDPELATVGDVFGPKNAERKHAFDIRAVMRSVVDQDRAPLERWPDFRDAETAVVWDAHVGGWPVCVLGIESHPIARQNFKRADGPDQWTSGTLFPRSSKKVARALNSASNNRPFVVLANLSGFDGSPESMRNLQLEYGAEIGRAVVNFSGPIVFAVISRYHGGAFVVFSKRLSTEMEVVALEGAHASVIGGSPAAAVVFSREVDARTEKDARVVSLEKKLEASSAAERAAVRIELAELKARVRSEKLGAVADEFDRIHSVERALAVGSLDRILPAAELRPYLIDAIERGVARTLDRLGTRR